MFYGPSPDYSSDGANTLSDAAPWNTPPMGLSPRAATTVLEFMDFQGLVGPVTCVHRCGRGPG
jgi:hypothetical protein